MDIEQGSTTLKNRHNVSAVEDSQPKSSLSSFKNEVLITNDEIEYATPPPSYKEDTHRKLKARHIQLIGIGGTIGTALFVQIGSALVKGGPGSLFLGFTLWCFPILAITATTAEMVSYLPISSPFIRLSGRCVDEAFEVMAGWNFFLFEAALIPFEITAVNFILHFWVDNYSPGIPLAVQIVLYALINIFAVRWYGESEYWLSIGKVILAVGLIFFTFITMVGGNPQHHAYGFTYWNNPGAFAEYIATGSWGKFLGFFACLTQAAFTIAGPDYVSMAAGEAENPRNVMPKAFKTVFYRLTCFFVLGALCIGIVVPYNDPTLLAAIKGGAPGAAASPYVVAMQHLGINVLPHIVNGLVLTAAFSAGNSYTYCASRTLYGLALAGHAPKVFAKCNKRGVPVYAVLLTLCAALLAFLQLGETSQTVLSWIVNLVTASQLINFCVLCTTYLFFRRAMIAQGISRDTLPFKSWGQPYTAYFGLVCPFIMMFLAGYEVFLDWSTPTFLFSYLMIPFNVVIYCGWKIVKKTKIRRPEEVDLTSGLKEILEHSERFIEQDEQRYKPWYRRIGTTILGC
jgi:amino acid transporter